MARATIQRAVSTWSLHRTLGGFVANDSAVGGGRFMPGSVETPAITLLDLIPELASRGYEALQICHFHLETRDSDYLARLRAALSESGIAVDALLIDDGDLTAPDLERQLAWYDEWLTVAEQLGARRARICAGRSAPTPDRLRQSGESLALLARRHPGIRIVTENWMELTPNAASVEAVLDSAGNEVGLLIDLGNWRGEGKYDELAVIAPRAETCHAKCLFQADGPDVVDFQRTLGILRGAGFAGPLAFIYDGPDPDEWAGLDQEWAIVESVWNA